MGLYAERHYEAKEHPRRPSRAPIQFRRLHDALHVSFHLLLVKLLICFCLFLLSFVVLILNFNYRTIYNMCTQKPPHDYSQQLYDKYREAFEEYITSTVREVLSLFVCTALAYILALICCFKMVSRLDYPQ